MRPKYLCLLAASTGGFEGLKSFGLVGMVTTYYTQTGVLLGKAFSVNHTVDADAEALRHTVRVSTGPPEPNPCPRRAPGGLDHAGTNTANPLHHDVATLCIYIGLSHAPHGQQDINFCITSIAQHKLWS